MQKPRGFKYAGDLVDTQSGRTIGDYYLSFWYIGARFNPRGSDHRGPHIPKNCNTVQLHSPLGSALVIYSSV